MKTSSTAAAATLVMIGATAFLAPSAQAATTAQATTTSQAGSAPVPTAAVTLPPKGHVTGYVQRAGTVSLYRDGKVLAKVTADSAAHPHGKGKLALTIEAKKAFSFRAGQFLWEDEDGGDHEAVDTGRKISVAANTTRSVSITYDGVGNGDVIWVRGQENVVGAWLVEGRAAKDASNLLPASYVQRGSTVTVYRSGRVVARVTPQSAKYPDGKGLLRLKVEAVKKFRLAPSSFVWEDKNGGDVNAVRGQKAVTFKAKTVRTISVRYADVADGSVFWAPRPDVVAGYWTIS